MKTALKPIAFILLLCITLGVNAQTTKSKTTTTTKSKTTAKKTTPAAPVKEVTVTLKNLCERSVSVFSGPKAEIRDPKTKVVGGLSKNTLYVKTNQVVCIIGEKGKIMACTDVKPSTTTIEINSSATGITAK